MVGGLMRALWIWGRAYVQSLSESRERKVGREEERWVLKREEVCLCLFSLRVCEKKGISWEILRLGKKKGSCQEVEEQEHRLASLPRQTQNLIATGARKQPGVSN